MYLIANGSQAASVPTPAAPVGTPGYATFGNPATGVVATTIDSDNYNRIMLEIIAPILAAGLSLSQSNNAQLLAALQMLFRGQNFRVFTSSGGFVPPSGVTLAKVRLIGGGGAGGGSPTNGAGSGGGSGGYAEGVVSVTPSVYFPISIGAGGTGLSNASGGNGGTTSFSSLLSATGGTGGAVGTAGANASGAAGGTATGSGSNLLLLPGTYGTDGIGLSAIIGGDGGNGPLGGAGRGANGGSTPANASANTGAGGGGSYGGAPYAGGNGGSGLCIVEY